MAVLRDTSWWAQDNMDCVGDCLQVGHVPTFLSHSGPKIMTWKSGSGGWPAALGGMRAGGIRAASWH